MLQLTCIFILTVTLFTGCVHYPKSIDDSYYSTIQKTPYTASLNFYSRKYSRIDDSKTAKAIANEFHKAGIFQSENLEYIDYLTPNNLIIDCENKVDYRGIFGANTSQSDMLAIILPIPTYHESKLTCSVHDKSGLKTTYSSSFEYSVYPFFLFIPFAIIHSIAYPSTYPEQILAQDIVKKMNDDQLKVFSSEILKQ